MSVISTFISGIGIKDYLYAGAIAVILAGGAWFVHHERVVGEQKIIISDTKVAEAAHQHVVDVQTIADAKETIIGATYAKTITTPPAAVPVYRLCHVAPASRAVPTTASTHPGAPGAADSGSADTNGLTAGPDIGLKLVTIGHDADALITALQAENAELRAEMK